MEEGILAAAVDTATTTGWRSAVRNGASVTFGRPPRDWEGVSVV